MRRFSAKITFCDRHFSLCPEIHAYYEMHELYDRHHKVSPTLNCYENKTQIILSNMKSYETKKGLSYIKYPKSGLGAFLDISDFSGRFHWFVYLTFVLYCTPASIMKRDSTLPMASAGKIHPLHIIIIIF